MPLGAAERETLFGTPVVSYQIQLYLLKRPGFRAGGKELRTVFSDLSMAAFATAVIALESKGIIAEEDGDVVIFPEKASIRGIILDRCWKAMRMEGRFTVDRIAELTGYSHVQVREAIRRMTGQHAVRIVFKAPRKPVVYQIVKDTVIRPAPKKARCTDSKVARAWELAHRLAVFSFADIASVCGVSKAYAKELIRMFRQSGYLIDRGLGPDGHTRLYSLDESAPDEPPVVTNRTRIRRLGY